MPRIIPEENTSGSIAADIDVAGPLTNAPSAPTDLETVLSEFDSAFGGGGITGDHPALLDPANVDDLVDFMEPVWRPEFNSASLGTNLYVGDWSGDGGGADSDTTGVGSLAFPFSTIAKAIQLIGRVNPAAVTINLARGGTFDLPGLISHYNWINIDGFEADLETATQTGAAVQADEEALIIDVIDIASGGSFIDDLQGQLIEWTSGSASSNRGWIRHNDVTDTEGAGITRLTVSQDDVTSLKIPADTDTLKLIDLTTTLRLTEFFHVFQSSVQFNINSVIMSDTAAGTFVMFPVNTDKIGCRDIRFEIGRIQVARTGGLELFNCYVGNLGDSSRGMISVKRGGDLQILRGTVVDGDFRAIADANRFMEIENAAKCSFDGNSIFMGLGPKGLQWDGGDVASQDAISSHHAWSFDDCDAGVRINTLTTGLAGFYQLPNLHGTVGSTYSVIAEECACVELGPSSSITSDAGINMVSADGGTNPISFAPDTTIIVGGDPAPPGLVDFGARPSASEPLGINDGDRYYNTDLDMEMRYDLGRAKWLSINEAWYQFGRDGNTAAGSFFEGTGAVQFTSTNGHPAPFDGTVVGIAFTRDDVDSTTVEVTLDGTLITGAEVTSTSTSNNDSTINADFTSAGTAVLGVRNQSSGATITDVMGWIRIKWRA